MSISQETPIAIPRVPGGSPLRRNGRWSGYLHLLMARMLELKREPEVIFWVFVFPLLLALGLGIAFRNKPSDAPSVAIVSGAGSEQAKALLERSRINRRSKSRCRTWKMPAKAFASASMTS